MNVTKNHTNAKIMMMMPISLLLCLVLKSAIIEQKKVPMVETVHNRPPNEMADLKENSFNSR